MDDFRDPPPPPCLYFPSIFEWSPSESFQSFKRSQDLFGFLVTTDPPFCSPKNQVISPKIVRHPPPPSAINNDRSLTAGYFVGRGTFWAVLHQVLPSQKPRSALVLACSLRSRTVELSKKRKKRDHGILGVKLPFEGLNGVYRQPSNGLKINRQPSKMQVKINCQKVSKYFKSH